MGTGMSNEMLSDGSTVLHLYANFVLPVMLLVRPAL